MALIDHDEAAVAAAAQTGGPVSPEIRPRDARHGRSAALRVQRSGRLDLRAPQWSYPYSVMHARRRLTSSRQPIGPTIDASLGGPPFACQDFQPSGRDGPARAASRLAETVRAEAITEACQGVVAAPVDLVPTGAPV